MVGLAYVDPAILANKSPEDSFLSELDACSERARQICQGSERPERKERVRRPIAPNSYLALVPQEPVSQEEITDIPVSMDAAPQKPDTKNTEGEKPLYLEIRGQRVEARKEEVDGEIVYSIIRPGQSDFEVFVKWRPEPSRPRRSEGVETQSSLPQEHKASQQPYFNGYHGQNVSPTFLRTIPGGSGSAIAFSEANHG